MNDSTELTGKVRYSEHKRFGRDSLLVLEVEEHHKGTYFSHSPTDVHGRDYDSVIWRHATVRDLPELYKGGYL